VKANNPHINLKTMLNDEGKITKEKHPVHISKAGKTEQCIFRDKHTFCKTLRKSKTIINAELS
jgi:hypothetical protein